MQGQQLSHAGGFTLFELIVTVTIFVILLTLAFPPLSNFVERQKALEISQGVISQMRAARSLAINAGKPVIICGSTNGKDCVKTNFSQLLVFVDDNLNHHMDTDELQLTSRSFDTRQGNLFLKASLKLPYIQFTPNGFANSGSFIYCPHKITKRQLIQRITTNKSGRAYIAPVHTKFGEVRMADDTKIECTRPEDGD